jgi:hypothetical protein
MANDIFTKIKIALFRGIGWVFLIVFTLTGLAGFLAGEFLAGAVSLAVAFIGLLLTRYKREKKGGAAHKKNTPIHFDKKNHWKEEDEPDKEAAPVHFDKKNRWEEEDEPDIADLAMASIQERRRAANTRGIYENQPEERRAVKEEKGVKPIHTLGEVQENKINYEPLQELYAEIESDVQDLSIRFEPPVSLKIVYQDYEGETTTREIDVNYIEWNDFNDDYYIHAFCRLRNAKRTFKIWRVQRAIVDGNTVDIIPYLVDAYRDTDKYKETVLSIKVRQRINSSDATGRAARVLIYISRIDGVFTRKKKTTIADYIKELDNNQNDIEIEDYVKELAYIDPSAREYKSIVKSMDISESLVAKAKAIAGKDPLRRGAFEILLKQYEKNQKSEA